MAKIKKVSEESSEKIRRKSAYILPDNPTACGWKPKDIRDTLFRAITDTANSALAEIDRVVDEANGYLPETINVSYDEATGKLTVSINNEDGAELAKKSTMLAIDTAALADCSVTEDKLSDALQEFVAGSKNSISGLLEREADKQAKIDNTLTTAAKTVTGAINELDREGKAKEARLLTAEAKITALEQTVEAGIVYIGTWMYDAEDEEDTPDDERLTDYVSSVAGESPSGGELVLAVQKLPADTDRTYFCLFSKAKNKWDIAPVPNMELSSANSAGLVQGGFNDDNTLYVDIRDGKIADIKAGEKGEDGTFTAVSIKGLKKLSGDMESLLAGSVSAKRAERAECDSEGNTITDTYMTKSAGASKAYVRKYALPVEFNDALYITSGGLVRTVPDDSGAQFEVESSQIGYVDLFTAAYNLHDDEGGTKFELSAKNSFTGTVFMHSAVAETLQFRVVISAGSDATGESNRMLAVVVTLDTYLAADTLTAVTVTGLFDSLEDDILKLDGTSENACIVMKMQAIRTSSKAQKYSIFCNSDFRSAMHLSTAFQTVAITSGKVGELPQMRFTSYDLGEDDAVIFKPSASVPAENSVVRVILPYLPKNIPTSGTSEHSVKLTIGGVEVPIASSYRVAAITEDLEQCAIMANGQIIGYDFLMTATSDGADGMTYRIIQEKLQDYTADLAGKVDKATADKLTSARIFLYGVRNTGSAVVPVLAETGETPLEGTVALRANDGSLQFRDPTAKSGVSYERAGVTHKKLDESLAGKIDKVTTGVDTAFHVYAYKGTGDNKPTTQTELLAMMLSTTGKSLARRREDGSLLVEEPKETSGYYYELSAVNHKGQNAELAKKVNKVTSTTQNAHFLYGTAAGSTSGGVTQQTDTTYEVANAANAGSVPLRDSAGRMKAALPSEDDDVANKEFVNSSIANVAADYISSGGEPFSSLTELTTYTQYHPDEVGPNDYAIVKTTDSDGNKVFSRYKYKQGKGWEKEYDINNSSFTAEQWAAINSGATAANIGAITGKLDRSTTAASGGKKNVYTVNDSGATEMVEADSEGGTSNIVMRTSNGSAIFSQGVDAGSPVIMETLKPYILQGVGTNNPVLVSYLNCGGFYKPISYLGYIYTRSETSDVYTCISKTTDSFGKKTINVRVLTPHTASGSGAKAAVYFTSETITPQAKLWRHHLRFEVQPELISGDDYPGFFASITVYTGSSTAISKSEFLQTYINQSFQANGEHVYSTTDHTPGCISNIYVYSTTQIRVFYWLTGNTFAELYDTFAEDEITMEDNVFLVQ